MDACRLTNNILSSIQDDARERISKDNAIRDTLTFLLEMAVNYKIVTPSRASKVASEVMAVLKEKFPIAFPEWATKKNLENTILHVDLDYVQYNNANPTPQISEDYNDKELRKDTRRDFLRKAYGKNYMLSSHALGRMRRYIADALYVNRGSIKETLDNEPVDCVEDIEDLNDNIRILLELMFQNVISFIRTLVDLPEDLRLYDDEGEYTGVLEDSSIVELINDHIGSVDDISLLYNRSRDLERTAELSEKNQIDAYNDWVALNNFDNYISLIEEEGISFKINSVGKMMGGNKYKRSANSQQTYWNGDTDDVMVKETTDHSTRLLIETVPIITWDGKPTDRLLDFNDWAYVISSIKSLVYNSSSRVELLGDARWNNSVDEGENFSENTNEVLRARNIKTLNLLISLLPSDGQRLLPVLFDILSNLEFKRYNGALYKGFNNDILSKIRSINEGLFNGDRSLRELSTAWGDYYGYVAESALSIYDNNMFLYYQDLNGILKVRYLMDNTLRRLEENIRSNVNDINSHYLITDWNKYADSLKMMVNNDTMKPYEYLSDLRNISFIVPNTSLKIIVEANRGVVKYDSLDPRFLGSLLIDLLDSRVIEFIDSVLGLNLSRNYDLRETLSKANPDYLELLLTFASRTTFLKYLLNTAFKSDSHVYQVLGELTSKFQGINKYHGELSLVHGSDSNTIDMIAEALGIVRGLTTSSIVYDSKRNAYSKQSMNCLKVSRNNLFELLNKKHNSITKHFSILNAIGLLGPAIKFNEYTDGISETKKPVKMSTAEHVYANFVHDFIGGMFNTGSDSIVNNGKVLLVSAVHADKSDISKLLVDLNVAPITSDHPLAKSRPELVDKPLIEYADKELISLINYDLGGYYLRMINVVRNDLGKLDNGEHPSLAQGLESNFVEFNEWVRSTYPKITPSEYLNNLVYEYNEGHPNDPVELVDITHYRTLDKGDIASNQVMLALLDKYSDEHCIGFWRSKLREVVKLLLDEDFVLNTSNTMLPELLALRKELGYDTNGGWINKSGNMILCRVESEGEVYNISSKADAEKSLGSNWYDRIQEVRIEVNPLLCKYNLIDHLITLEYLNCTVGSFTNHPYKGELTHSNLFELEATQQEAQNKRNVSLTTPVILFLLNDLNGISDEYNIAVIDEYFDKLGNVNGLISEFNAIDAATFSDNMTTILENYSIGGSKAGIIKKPFIHAYNERTGTGFIDKTAVIGLDNNSVRNSPLKQLILKKMLSRTWKDQEGNDWIVDITGKKRPELKLDQSSDIPYLTIFYSQPFFNESTLKWEEHYYKVRRTINTGDNEYEVHYVRVEENGDILRDDDDNIVEDGINRISIRSNYDLWNYFGGKDSMELRNGKLVHSNTSSENCVIAANNLGIRNSENIHTQADFYQPLKHSNIHYLSTKGAIKQGGANINPKERFSDEKHFTFLRVKLYNAGIVLDKEHTIEEDEVVSISTLAISSSVLRGRTFESAYNMYKALGFLSNLNAGDHVELARLLFLNPDSEEVRSEFEEMFNKSVMQSLLRETGNYNNFALNLAENIVNRMREGGNSSFQFRDLKVPLSDGTIYNRVLTSINSYLTSVGIRTKLPGISAILSPSHRLYRIYAGKKWGEYINPEEELKTIQANTTPVYLKVSNGEFNTSISNLELNRTYNIEEILEDGSIREVTKLIATPEEYLQLKDEVIKGRIQSITENVLVGRDLSSYNVRFKTTEGGDFLLYDLDSIRALYELELINAISKESEKFERFIDFTERWKEVDDGVRYLNSNAVNKVLRGDAIDNDLMQSFNSQFYRAARRVIDKWKQFDLNNLSKEVSEDRGWYYKLLERKNRIENNPEELELWYKEYGCKVNIKFGLKQGSQIKILNRSIENLYDVNDDTFDEINSLVEEWLRGINKVKISDFSENGERHIREYKVDKESINESPYEIIMPLTFGKLFGLTLDSNVSEIVNDKSYFIKQLIDRNSTKTDAKNYSIELKVSSGNHLYILDKDSVSNTNLTKVESPLVLEESGSRYKVDYDGNILYELDNSADIYLDEIGNEIIATNDIKFYLDNLDYYSVKMSGQMLAENELLFRETLLAMHNSTNEVARDVADRSVREAYEIVSDEEGAKLRTFNNEKILLQNNDLNNATELNKFILKRGNSMYNSFMEALNVIAARTPGLSMLSFMAMKIVAFDDSNTNVAYVSTMLNLLLGSDYDIDTISIFTYDINRNGTIQLWSPYADLTTMENLKASKLIPLPTSKQVDGFKTSTNTADCLYVFDAYGDQNEDGCLKIVPNFDGSLDVKIDTSTPLKIDTFISLLNHVDDIIKPTDSNIDEFVTGFNNLFPKLSIREGEWVGTDPRYIVDPAHRKLQINNQRLAQRTMESYRQITVNSLYDQLEQLLNDHNMFLVNSSKSKRTKIINNYLIANLINIIGDASNLELAQSPTDDITKPLKRVADNTPIAAKMRSISSGNVVGKFKAYTQSVVGKEDVGIAAVGMKTFAGLTEYYDYVLNHGNAQQQSRLVFPKHEFKRGGLTRRILANAYVLDLDNIQDMEVLEELAKSDNTSDAALTLAAIISLAADNAKDLKLGKLNAGTATLGMYLYGVMIGKPFSEVSELLTSEAGMLFSKLLLSNVFTDSFGFYNADEVSNYFLKRIDNHFLNKYNTTRGLGGLKLSFNPLLTFILRLKESFERKFEGKNINSKYEGQVITKFARTKGDLKEKLDIINEVRNLSIASTYERELYNLLCDFVEDYVIMMDSIDLKDIEDLKILADGSQEIRELGLLYSTNLRLDTATDKFIRQVNNIRDALRNRSNNKKKSDRYVDPILFIFDADYKEKIIATYDEVKHTFNILEAPFVAPHYTAYMESLATALMERSQSFKFRNMISILRDFKIDTDLDAYVRSINRFLDDYVRNLWLMQTRQILRLPKGSKVFTNEGKLVETGGNTDILLGTDAGNASFKLFMESVVIPDLKLEYSGNNFVLDLQLVSTTRTVTKNATPVYSLGINMMPRGDLENAILESYRHDFNNDFSGRKYEIKDADGNVLLEVLIGDLFTYYGMIAHGWQVNERSLVPILQDYQSTSALSRSYQDFQSAYDKDTEKHEWSWKELAPYIALIRNPYRSTDPYIYSIDSHIGRYRLMGLMDDDVEIEDDNILDDLEQTGEFIRDDNIKGNYIYMSQRDIRNFPTGEIRPTSVTRDFRYSTEDSDYVIRLSYDVGSIEGLKDNKNSVKLTEVPTFFTRDGDTIRFEEFGLEMPVLRKDGKIIFNLDDLVTLFINLC